MKKVFIVHGFGGIPNGGWISWVMTELSKSKTYACSLPMPHAGEPVVLDWINEISTTVDNASEDEIFLVGHSLGATAVLRYLENEKARRKISGVILVSGFTKPLKADDPNHIYRKIDSFTEMPFDFNKIKSMSDKFVVIHSIDDPAVPFVNAEIISKELGCQLVKLEKGGHFFILSEPICYEFPELLKTIEDILI